MCAVAVEVDVDFRAIDVRHAPLVVEIFVIVGEIRLAEVGLRIIDDDLQLFLGGVVQQLFDF